MKNKQKANMHTSIDKPNFMVKMVRLTIKIVNFFSSKLALRLVTKLFCKPIKKNISSYQEKFYNSGLNTIIDLNGYKVNVLEKGQGQPVLLIHGWNNNAFNMRHIAKELVSNGYKVIVPDLPCHGKSSGRFINQIQMGFALQELFVHIEKKYGNFNLVTYSWGGTVSLLALDQLQQKGISIKPKSITSLALPTYPGAITDLFCKMLQLSPKLQKGLLDNLEAMANTDNRSLKEAFPLSFYENIEKAQVKLTIVHDTDDRAIVIDNCEKFLSKYPETECVVTEGLGHLKIVKCPNVINNVLTSLSA